MTKTNIFSNRVYEEGLNSVEHMGPHEFLKYYLSYINKKYSRIFNSVNLNDSRAVLSKNEIWTLFITNRNFYGYIYKITRVKDIKGNKIKNGPIRIGYSTYPFKIRYNTYMSVANPTTALTKRRNNFHKDLWNYKHILGSFKIEIWDICYNKVALENNEKFWIIYFNRKNNNKGYDLRKNKRYNPIVGSLFRLTGEDNYKFKHVPKDTLENMIREGFSKNDIAHYFKVDKSTIEHKIEWYWSGKTFRQKRDKLLKELIEIWLLEGLTRDEVIKKIKKPRAINPITHRGFRKICNRIFGWTYDKLRMWIYEEKLLLECIIKGMTEDEASIKLRYETRCTCYDRAKRFWGVSYLEKQKEYLFKVIIYLMKKGYNAEEIALKIEFPKVKAKEIIKIIENKYDMTFENMRNYILSKN